MTTPVRILVATVAIALLAWGVWEVRDATMTTHEPVAPESRLAVVIEASTRHGEGGQSLHQMATGKVLMCRLETRTSDPVGDIQPVPNDPGRFRFILEPALDDADRKQFEGCIEDWNLDHILVDVVDMQEVRSDQA